MLYILHKNNNNLQNINGVIDHMHKVVLKFVIIYNDNFFVFKCTYFEPPIITYAGNDLQYWNVLCI